MTDATLLFTILIPLTAGIASFVLRKRFSLLGEAVALAATLANLFLAVMLYTKSSTYFVPWLGNGIEFSLKVYHFSAFILLATAGFGFLITLYSSVFMRGKEHVSQFYAYLLITLAFTNGAVLADNLLIMLFFWEGLLLTLFGMIAIGRRGAFKTATKALIIIGISDLCMMLGILITGHLAGTLTISKIHLPLGGMASVAFILLMIGAISKAGSMPFHSWIPDASFDASLPFMALLPAALEKLLGIYFLTRISLDMFALSTHSRMSTLLMSIGALTILLAVMMALVQKEYKKLLSYHAISQVGYMILGIGTAVPAGIVGGLFHMINNALYKSALFLTAGSVEKQTGTTDLEKLGGIGAKMPVTFGCFVVTALAISGVPPFNGFFSKELVYDGALERGLLFYIAASLGSFFTAASFLKLGHAAFLGKLHDAHKNVKEAHAAMLLPMLILAFTCILFGVYNVLPIRSLIQPVLGEQRLEGHSFCGMPANTGLVCISVIVLAGALLNHLAGVRSKGSGLKAVDHIHHAPGLSQVYSLAEKRFFDPYEIGMRFVRGFSRALYWGDRLINWISDGLCVTVARALSVQIRQWHSGNYAVYLSWSLIGLCAVVAVLLLRG